MIKQRLLNYSATNRCTLLGVGPMSKLCVDATLDIANDYSIPLMLIASRRQIDSEEFGKGYVNNWSTKEFADYVIDNDIRGKVILARDHGGPWQSEKEKAQKLSLRKAMDSAKRSFLSDIEAGFQMIHIDPSINLHGEANVEDTLERIYELYYFCWTEAKRLGKDIIFEVGTEEQSGSTNTPEQLEYVLKKIKDFCGAEKLPYPAFVVIQTGTKVMEMENVGSFDSPFRVKNELPAEIQISKMIELCNKYGIMMKEHNTDYLSSESLSWHPRFGIHAANVAPEFGVAESRALLELLKEHKLTEPAQAFIDCSLRSDKWKKWMKQDSQATDEDRAIISGHYVFSAPEVIELKREAADFLKKKGIELDEHLKEKVRESIMRYVTCFRLLRLEAVS